MNRPPLQAEEAWHRLLSVRTEPQAEAAGLYRRPDGSRRWRQPATPQAHHLADVYAPLCLAGPALVFAQLGQSMDGFIATRTGHSDYVTGRQDRLHLHRLRALADAVIVGANTAVADDPQLTVRACPGPNPVRVVLDPQGRALHRAPNAQLFTDGRGRTLHVIDQDSPQDPKTSGTRPDVLRVPCGEEGFAPHTVLAALAARGLGRILVEGGGRTVSRFLHAHALDRLYLTIAPVLLGDGVPGLRFCGPDRMDGALRPPVRTFALGQDTLFALDLRARTTPDQETDNQHPGARQA
ncbi:MULTISPECIES: RibD family protein [unclassified Streptomyces]|uniref:RibD family protein n=1 Tax=unclassified Streptomyces TaxID=2593676 RepID=UPI000376FCDD|nr:MULTISPECIES: RibD family protein [unclassified Streptomyces]MYT32248.1 deaminase [Streptomyces sp. SID8354]